MKREILLTLDDGIRGWIASYAKKNYWRVMHWYDLDDLIHDGFVVFYRVKTKYADRIKNRSHLIALFKTSYVNHIHDLSKFYNRHNSPNHGAFGQGKVEAPISELIPTGREDTGDPSWLMDQYIQDDSFEMLILIAHAPEELRKVFKMVTEADFGDELRSPYTMKEDGSRETTNERLCRLAGIEAQGDHFPDIVSQVRAYLQPA